MTAPLQNAVAASGQRAPAYVLGIRLLYGLLLGRTVCVPCLD